MKFLSSVLLVLMLAGCATHTVRQQDLDAWVGEPMSSLELHPFFITTPVVKTKASDGTEIWNYVNGRNIGSCSNGGSIYSGTVSMATYNTFTNCISNFGACNNIFYIRDGVVQRYVPTGSGGMGCFTTKELQPQLKGSTNFR